ncbi:MAG: heparinase II/III-family protein [Thermoleophilia bacterium]
MPCSRWARACWTAPTWRGPRRAGGRGPPPARTAATFPVSGYVVQRSGLGHRPRRLRPPARRDPRRRPLGDGGHGHYDQLSVVLADGRALVTDPGRYTYAEDDAGWRRWFKGTAAHNTVCVDGLDQVPYRRGKPRGPLPHARVLGRTSEPGLDLVTAAAESPCHDAVHTRTLAFVGRAFWVVHDRLRAATPHRYEARWHLGPDVPVRRLVRHPGGRALVDADGLRIAVPAGFGEAGTKHGWVSPRYGEKLPAVVVTVAAEGAADADLITVLVPGGGPVEAAARRGDGGVEVTVGAVGARWHLRWDPDRPEHAELEMGPW